MNNEPLCRVDRYRKDVDDIKDYDYKFLYLSMMMKIIVNNDLMNVKDRLEVLEELIEVFFETVKDQINERVGD